MSTQDSESYVTTWLELDPFWLTMTNLGSIFIKTSQQKALTDMPVDSGQNVRDTGITGQLEVKSYYSSMLQQYTDGSCISHYTMEEKLKKFTGLLVLLESMHKTSPHHCIS